MDISERLETIAHRYLKRDQTCELSIAEACVAGALEIEQLRKAVTTAREEGRKQGLDEAANVLASQIGAATILGASPLVAMGNVMRREILALKDKKPLLKPPEGT